MRCPRCSSEISDAGTPCPRCGALEDVGGLLTGTAPRPRTPSPASPAPRGPRSPGTRTPGALGRTSAAAGGRFVPGEVVADRYRIVGLLGRGGMGEVYRADDLKLDQAVALKFLPEKLQGDVERLDRLYGEVRLARQIAHPSICRVYDVVEAEGTPFLSMEYVDGEDLASLLRRIGRLPADKALEIARQLCAGLAAAHQKGVLHRDLKPENVMIDGRGHVRVTDFGLAVAADAVDGHDVRSGTPAYMAPEQLAGREVSIRSEVYALGLVLYELFTGRKAVDAPTLAELERKVREEPPVPPSEVVPEIDPVVERAILRCLEKDPGHRPPSAVAVAAALPGGDPLAAALAAGETPSPELVAAAGRTAGLRPAAAWALLLAVMAALPLLPLIWQPAMLTGMVPVEKTPDALEDRARELLRRVGQTGRPADHARGLATDLDYLQRILQQDQSPNRWRSLAAGPPVVDFWYRQSARALQPLGTRGRVVWDDPPPLQSAMAGARFDMRGRLLHLYVVPPQLEDAPATAAAEADWSALFAEAGLDLGRFHEGVPRWTPPFFADTRLAWDGVHPERPDVPLRVEAASYRGQPVYFQVLAPWARADRALPFPYTRAQRIAFVMLVGLGLAVVVTAAFLARRHVRQGRGDKAGAHRLARYTTAVMMAAWALNADHVLDLPGELTMILRGLGVVLVLGGLMFVLYLALEPVVRRRWPQTLISWTRVLTGRWRDPLVGRDVLLGTAAGVVIVLLLGLALRLPEWVGQPATLPHFTELDALLGPRGIVTGLLAQQVDSMAAGLGFLLLLTLVRQLTGRTWAAVAVLTVILAVPDAFTGTAHVGFAVAVNVLVNGAIALLLVRAGLLACVVALYVLNAAMDFPITTDLTSWIATPTFWVAGVLITLAVYGFRTALAGRSAFAGALPSD